ncbi:protein of unknown function [Taphrina deformans PYCC 5710]|uniref:Major facilitator superfamily (MFS) profile domain-containing protein n=1 Tax=Taphrina deformans (strain PYCC 5710 / ATCC 11124 / CBS 356.35 / IMI 108563 / JCM 9778 / NBRC 8474) TaxID=1097556 RepID=R4XEY0_TAPDE|nr:protein of unknown function [Taphrina deformans PYCC 5710]|eukprot:CCG84422.1 protein of unknown function [Taphrina deformans PYCC 5710]
MTSTAPPLVLDQESPIRSMKKENESLDNDTTDGQISDAIPNQLRYIELTDPAHPIHWSATKKWIIISVYCLLEIFVALTSTTWVSIAFLIQERYGTSTQVTTLGQSMFIVGTAVGPAFLGPLSDISGRKWVYVCSILLYAIFMIGVALARNFPMMVVFMFLSGAAGSTALSNVAGTIADLYGDANNAGQAMALFVACANIGPSLGSPVGEWVAENPHMGLNWLFWLNVIIGGAFAAVLALVPETLPRVVIRRNPKHRDIEHAPVVEKKISVMREIYFVTSMALRIMTTEPIVISLGLYNGFAYGIIFLYLSGVFGVFVTNNGLSYIVADLTFLNFAAGVIVLFFCMPIQTWAYTRDKANNGGQGRPEARFLTSLVCVWGFPASLLWIAFTSNGDTSYWSPIVGGAVLAFVDTLLYLSMLSYITDSYPNVAGSAVAAFLIPSFLLAAGFAHIGIIMFERMSTTWAFATLGFISLGIVALVYILYYFGPALRRYSKLARNFDEGHDRAI